MFQLRGGSAVYALVTVSSLVGAALLSGCGGSSSTDNGQPSGGGASTTGTGTTGKAATHKKWVIGFSQCTVSEPWRVAMDNALQAEADKHKDEIEVVTKVGQDSSAQQYSDCENLLNSGIDLLIISPKEAAPLTPIVNKIFAKKIPVVVLDRGIVGDSYTCFIGGDNKVIGEKAGEFIARALNGKGNVVEIWGNVGTPPAKDRHDGFVDGLKNAHADAVKIIATGYGDWKKDKGHDQMRQILAAQPHIDLVYGQNDPMAMGAYLAASEMHREKEMKFVGIDGLPGPDGGCSEVKAGKLAATFLYPNCGKEAITYALQILHGQKVPKKITLPTDTITAANADQYINPK